MIGLPFGKQTRGKQELLKLLQDGKIQAVFDFPSAARPRISIPAEFWLDIQSGHFQKLLTWSKKSERYRQFLVEPVKFIGQYAALFGESYFGGTVSMEARAVAFAELESALAKVNRKKEAYILESEWARAARTGLQSDPRHEHHGCPTAHGGDDGIVSIRIINAPTDRDVLVSPLPRCFYTTKTHSGHLQYRIAAAQNDLSAALRCLPIPAVIARSALPAAD